MLGKEPYSALISMPVLEHMKRVFQAEFGNDFSKLPNRESTLFVLVQHGFASIRPMMEMLLDLGIGTDQVFMTTKPHTTPTEDMLPYFKETFKNYVPFQWSASQSVLDQTDIIEAGKGSRYKTLTAVTHKKMFEHFCDYLLRYQEGSNRKIENIIICDEGGKFLSQFIENYHKPDSFARRNLKDYHIVAIEHTKCGTYRPELRNLPFPLINMADSYIKTKVESKYIAESMFVYLDAVLQNLKKASSLIIGVVGGGNIGKEVLVFLSQQYADTPVIVFDLDHNALTSSDIEKLNWQNVKRVDSSDMIFQQSTVILGCTGKNFMEKISQDCFSKNPVSHIHLISCSSGDSEFQAWLQRMPDYKFESLKDIRNYTLVLSPEKRITLYNGGFPMNFYVQQPEGIPAVETVPLDKVQITRSMKLAAIVQALKLLEVTSYFPKKYDNSLKNYMKLDVIYQFEIIQTFYDNLVRNEAPESQAQIQRRYAAITKEVIADGSVGAHQPSMSSVLRIPHYITTNYQVSMQSQLSRQPQPVKCLVIHGTAGSGKTSLAQHYLQKQRLQHPQFLTRVILAETKEQWRSSLRDWAEELFPGLSELLKAEKDPKRQEQKIDQYLKNALSKQTWCIVIDNWDQNTLHIGEIEQLFLNQENHFSNGTLIMTTQGKSPYGALHSIDLSYGFTPEESRELLIKVMNLEEELAMTWKALGNETELQALIALLNHLPLAIILAGSYLMWENKSRREKRQTSFTYAHYQTMLDQKVTELMQIYDAELSNKGQVPRDLSREEFKHLKTQEAAVDLSLKKAIQPDARDPNMNLWQLLCFYSFIASDSIPQYLSKQYIIRQRANETTESVENIFKKILEDAMKYSLLQIENKCSSVDNLPSLHVHRVIQSVVREIYWPLLNKKVTAQIARPLPKSMLLLMQEMFLKILCIIQRVVRQNYWPKPNERVQNENVLSVTASLSKPMLVVMQETLWETLFQANEKENLKVIRAYLSHHEEWMRHCERSTENPLQQDINFSQFQYVLALAYGTLGFYGKAQELHEKALSKKIAYYSDKHVEVAKIQQSLGNVMIRLGDYSTAERLYKTALETKIEHYKEGHVEIARARQNLAMLWNILGKYAQAKEECQKSLEIMIKYYNHENDIEVAKTQGNLGVILMHLREYEDAKTFTEKALKTKRLHFGENHIEVATEQQNLGSILRRLKNHSKKEIWDLITSALKTKIEHYGEKHIEVANIKNILAMFLNSLDIRKIAKRLLQQSLEIKIAHYQTKEHIEVAKAQMNLAIILKNLGDYPEAEMLYKASLVIKMKHYGKEHFEVVKILYNLACLFSTLYRFLEAFTLLQTCENILKKKKKGGQYFREHYSPLKEKLIQEYSLSGKAFTHFKTSAKLEKSINTQLEYAKFITERACCVKFICECDASLIEGRPNTSLKIFISKAMVDVVNQYLNEDSRLENNNDFERAIKRFVIRKKVCLFSDKIRDAYVAAILLSLVETCKNPNIEAYDYFQYVLQKILLCQRDNEIANSTKELCKNNFYI